MDLTTNKMTMKMNDIVENISDTLPVMMYLHGFMSGANGAKQRQLQRQFKGRYRVIAPELDADPDSSLEVINRKLFWRNVWRPNRRY